VSVAIDDEEPPQEELPRCYQEYDPDEVATNCGGPSGSREQIPPPTDADGPSAPVTRLRSVEKASGPPPPTASGHDGHLPEVFWNARAELEHIRQAARSRLVAPDAVFGAILTRVAAITPHTVELPPIIGASVGLTFFSALVGPPESGKSAAAAVAAELLPAPSKVHDRLPIGSGEGFAECLFEMVSEPDEKTGKPVKVKRQTRNAAIFHIDEGATLGDLGSRTGSTLLPTLRTAWSHGALGAANASAERRRILDGKSYVYGVTMGLQPELAGPLLGDAGAGTPQRFLWLSALDPHAVVDGPEDPGPLAWEPRGAGDLYDLRMVSGGWQRYRLRVAGSIWTTVRAARVKIERGEVEVATLDAHRMLVRLKVAALLALLDSRVDVNEEDWHLAEIVLDVSRRVRQETEGALVKVERSREVASSDRQARREMRIEGSKAERAMTSATRSVGRLVVRHASQKHHVDQGGGCTRRCLTNAIAGEHRKIVALADVVEVATSNGWIRADGERWLPGESRPA